MSDGAKERTYLESDDEIRGQKFVCLSFLTPNRGLLRNKELFFVHKFLEFFALDHKIQATEGFMMKELNAVQNALSDVELALVNADVSDVEGAAALLKKQGAAVAAARSAISRTVSTDLEAFVKEHLADFKESTIVESYAKYMDINRQRLEDEFHAANDFQTTMHGLKVRGVYPTHDQAAARAKALSKKDSIFNIYVAEVGEWLPWDPAPEEIAESEYQDSDQGKKLNQLMKAYQDNAAQKDAFFEEQKRQAVAEAMRKAAEAKEKLKSDVDVGGAGAGAGLFDTEHADLAIQRRLEKAREATQE